LILGLSACIITYNEEDNIRRCLSSLSFASEIILLDSGSSDSTISIAKTFPRIQIHERAFQNYVDQKNYCMSLASQDWILFLDADEEVSPNLRQEIESLESEWENCSGFLIPRLTWYLGKWIRYGGWYPNYQTKLFKKSKGKFEGLLVHERVQLEGVIKKLKSPIYHYSYRNISDHLKFIDKYSSLAAQEKWNQGKNSGLIWAIGKSFYKFLYMFILKLGFLDGKQGTIIAILGSYYNFLKYIKLYELQLSKPKNNTKES
jgi:glycosyltransferase involved in cell wall biosynthesis